MSELAPEPFRVLVVGGAGVFGGRLVDAILASTDWHVVVAGRDAGRLEAFLAPRRVTWPGVRTSAAVLDAGRCTSDDVARTGASVVVDAAGPFQGAGYGLASAVVGAGRHYVDIADGRAFVCGFGSALDGAARAAGVVALTGASSTPALSNAVLDELTRDWARVDEVTVAISPGNRAPRGVSVVRAILSYAGRPLRVWSDGRWAQAPGWGLTRRLQIPGLGRRWASLCDTPDLDVVPVRFGVRRSVVFLAGLELPVLHLGLAASSLAVRLGALGSLAPFAGLARAAAVLLERFGTDRGGMLVQASGRDASGRDVVARWSLVAAGGDGPSVPIAPALAALRALADGRLRGPGARPCVGVPGLGLAAIEVELSRHRTVTARSLEAAGPPLFRRALGEAFETLPTPMRDLHQPGAWAEWSGFADVLGADTTLGRAAARLFGFPATSIDVPIRVTIAADAAGETWTRDFGGRTFRSRLSDARTPGQVEERFGTLSFRLALGGDTLGLTMAAVGWRLGPLPLPRWMVPASVAAETVDLHGRFRFDVAITFRSGWDVSSAIADIWHAPCRFPS